MNSVRGVGQQIAGISPQSLSSTGAGGGLSYKIESSRDEIHNVPYEMQPKNKSVIGGTISGTGSINYTSNMLPLISTNEIKPYDNLSGIYNNRPQ